MIDIRSIIHKICAEVQSEGTFFVFKGHRKRITLRMKCGKGNAKMRRKKKKEGNITKENKSAATGQQHAHPNKATSPSKIVSTSRASDGAPVKENGQS